MSVDPDRGPNCQARHLQQLLRTAGIRTEVVSGNLDVESQLEQFQTPTLNCLISCLKLTEGLNEPAIQTVWVRDSTRGPAIQMAGRVFRLHSGIPGKQIVKSIKTNWPMQRTAKPVTQFIWTDYGWRSLEINPQIEQVSQRALHAPARSELLMPSFLTRGISGRVSGNQSTPEAEE